MSYVDGYVIPVQKKDVKAYVKMALWGRKTWMKAGALQYFECVGHDLKIQPGCGVSFKKLAKLKPTETVFFSFIIYRNKAHRDAVNKKVFAEMSKGEMPAKMPFDMKRMTFGGFKTLVQG